MNIRLISLTAAPLLFLMASSAQASYGAEAHAGNNVSGGDFQTNASASFSNANVTAIASADVYHAALHAYAYSTNDPVLPGDCVPYDLHCNWGTTATAEFWEVITLKPSSDVNVNSFKYSFSLDGTKIPGKWWSWNSVTAYFYFGIDPNGFTHPNQLTGTDSKVEGTFTAPVGGEPINIFIREYLAVSAQGGAITDYSNTMKFDWQLPEGWTYTSESGVFMTAVPEPASCALMLGGLALLCARVRASRRQ